MVGAVGRGEGGGGPGVWVDPDVVVRSAGVQHGVDSCSAQFLKVGPDPLQGVGVLDGGVVQAPVIHGPTDPTILLLDRDQWAGPRTVSRLYYILLCPGVDLLLQGFLHRGV